MQDIMKHQVSQDLFYILPRYCSINQRCRAIFIILYQKNFYQYIKEILFYYGYNYKMLFSLFVCAALLKPIIMIFKKINLLNISINVMVVCEFGDF